MLREYIRDGPNATDTTLGFFVGGLLWWRIWAMGGVFMAALFASDALASLMSEGAWFPVLLIGIATGEVLVRLSPKYSLEKQY